MGRGRKRGAGLEGNEGISAIDAMSSIGARDESSAI